MSGYHEHLIAEAKKVAHTMERPMKYCGDILDRMPCNECGAVSISQCPVTVAEMRPTVDLINRTAYLRDVLLREDQRLGGRA